VAVFRGIPFAEAPVGELRFAAPRPARGWDGVRAAVSYGPPPPQPHAFGRDEGAGGAAGDDWLTINVWSPDPDPDAKLPVMVWVYGGAYTIGRSSSPEYDGGRLARDGGVVVVTFKTAWTTFAAHGHPGWPAYDTEKRLTQIFDTDSVVAGYPEETSRLIRQDHTFPAVPLIG